MSRVAIITDSNSGITVDEAKKLGVFVLPMPFHIRDRDFFEGVNIDQKSFYQMIDEGVEIGTSQPSPADVVAMWDDILSDYDQIVHMPMSSGLSGSCESARMLSQDYDGRVEVADNKRISVTLRRSVLDAKRMADDGMDAAAIRKKLEETGLDTSIYIMLDTLTYLKRGGRITPAAAAIGTLLKIRPVLQLQGEKLDAYAKARTPAQGRRIMIQAIRDDIQKRFAGAQIVLDMAYTYDETELLSFREEVMEAFPWAKDIHYDPLSLSVGCHIGPGALALAATVCG